MNSIKMKIKEEWYNHSSWIQNKKTL